MARVREMILAAPARGIADALAGLAARADSDADAARDPGARRSWSAARRTRSRRPRTRRRSTRGVAGSTLEIIPGAGHLSAMEDPAAFNAALLGFLKPR